MCKYKKRFIQIMANKFQPDCCSSLVYAWFNAMKRGVSSGEEWCQKAHREAQNSQFYASHITRNGVIQGTGRIATLQKTREVYMIMSKRGFDLENIEMLRAARSIALSINPSIDDLKNKKPESDALAILGFRILRSDSVNPETTLLQAINSLSSQMKFYTVSLKASAGSHIIGIVSTKADGIFSPKGHLYYYDPNLLSVVKWRSRDDLKKFLDTLKVDYQGIRVFTELGIR